MWDFRERGGPDHGRDALSFLLGAAGGFALGMLLAGRAPGARARALAGSLRDRAGDLRDRAQGVAARLRPRRSSRPAGERGEFAGLEDAVLDVFLADEILGERGIDVGAVGDGIIELSGAVWTVDEADRAVSVASGVDGVETVVNRIDVDADGRRHWPLRSEASAGPERSWTGMGSGMGRRRQGAATDPDRPDDSQHIREAAIEDADRAEFALEGYAAYPRMARRPEVERSGPSGYAEDELDNQDP